MGRVEGKVAFVTGAARGQGRAHALRLAEEGADIIAIDICDQIATVPYGMASSDDLEKTATEVEALDRRIVTRQADVRDASALRSALGDGESELGPVDILVVNHGILSSRPSDVMEQQVWQDVIDTNLTGVWNACQAVLPGMKERGDGSLVLTSSTAGIKGFPTLAHYTAAKHGVVGLMKALAGEFGAYGIRVNTVHPTAVDTEMIQNDALYHLFRPDLENPGRDDFGEVFKSLHLLPHTWVDSRDISNAVLFLASDEARYITGQQLKVDLGYCEK